VKIRSKADSLKFESFGQTVCGTMVTELEGAAIVYSRNPYGNHNLVLVDWYRLEAIRHGNTACLAECLRESKQAYRKARKFLAARGRCLDIHLEVV